MPSISVLNETCPNGNRTILDQHNMAFYLHVDDGGLFGSGDATRSNQLLDDIANDLEAIGFNVPDRKKHGDLDKLMGYAITSTPATFSLPVHKGALLQKSLQWLAEDLYVHTGLLRSLLGVWIWGALLNRPLLSIPWKMFQMIDQHEDQLIKWWPSARRECKAM